MKHYLRLLKVTKNKKVIMFGAGEIAKVVSDYLPFEICYYLDNDQTKWGKPFGNSKILSPASLNNERREDIVVLVASSIFYKEISKQLDELGFTEFEHYFPIEEFYNSLILGPVISYWNERYLDYRKVYDIDPTFRFNGEGTMLYGDGEIVMGENSYIGRYSNLGAIAGTKIEIGKYCQIGPMLSIYTGSEVSDHDFSQQPIPASNGSVIIGDYCWTGARVFIREGITIGDNAVIGANSVVTHDIPSYAIAAGVPCRILKYKERR